VSFPEEGDWEIELVVQTPERTAGSSIVFVNISKEGSRWGWVESHEGNWDEVPSPPTVEEWKEVN